MRFSRTELLAGAIVALVLIGTPVLSLAYQMNRVSDFYLVRVNQDTGFSPAEIYVQPGEQVKLQLHADDVVHGFQSFKLGISVAKIYPGKPVTIEFTAPSQPGVYSFSCQTRCGLKHGDMVGKIVVVSP